MKVTKSSYFKKSRLDLASEDFVSVFSILNKLELSPVPIGKKLRPPLENCRSLRTGHRGQLRIVYLLRPDNALLLIVGARENLEVYSRAAVILRELGL